MDLSSRSDPESRDYDLSYQLSFERNKKGLESTVCKICTQAARFLLHIVGSILNTTTLTCVPPVVAIRRSGTWHSRTPADAAFWAPTAAPRVWSSSLPPPALIWTESRPPFPRRWRQLKRLLDQPLPPRFQRFPLRQILLQ